MDSKTYWQLREEEALKHRITDEREYDKEIKRIYSEMLDNIQKEIDGFYGRYATKEGISLAEAKKRVSKLDIERYERKAEKYVREKDFSDKANEEMRIYNLTMKVNRLELLKAQIGLETIAGHDALQKYLESILKGRTLDELERQAGILGKSLGNNAKAAHAIVNGSFHNGTFSDRIWQYQDLMRIELGKQLQIGLIQGKNPRAIARSLEKFWYGNDPLTGGGAVYCMERLMRTELARVQTEAQKQSFDRNGFDMFMFIANHGCCPDCQRLNGKTFRVSKMMPGENAAPLHPNCRCSVAAHEDSAEYEAWLDYLSKGGTTAEWNSFKKKNASQIDYDKGFNATNNASGKLTEVAQDIINEKNLQIQMEKANVLLDNYTKSKTRWSGNVIVDDSLKAYGKTNRATGDISVRSNTPIKSKIHELLHCRTNYDMVSQLAQITSSKTNEAITELLAEMICDDNGITYKPTYTPLVNALRNIAKIYNGNEMEFAKELFEIPYSKRYDWIEKMVYDAIDNDSVDVTKHAEMLDSLGDLYGDVKRKKR